MGQETLSEWLIRFVLNFCYLCHESTMQNQQCQSAQWNLIKKLCFFLLQDRFKDWESSGVKIVPVLSQPDGNWTGESGYVQVECALEQLSFGLVSSL